MGYWYRLFRGEYGRIERGNQIVYIHRNLWSGIGRAPQGGDLVVYRHTSFGCVYVGGAFCLAGNWRQFGFRRVSTVSFFRRRQALAETLQYISPTLPLVPERLRFSPDGAHIFARSASGVTVLAETLAILFRVPAADTRSAEFTPDSRDLIYRQHR